MDVKLLSKEKIDYIYHLADIHIRNSIERKEEYEGVFEKLYNKLKKEPKGLIVICGDIYHSKSQLSSESLLLFHKLMKISELMPTVLISGNHDGSTVNNELKDSIQGSIHKYDKNVYYLDKTGLYQYGDIIFSSKHFFDTKTLIKANEIKDKKAIKIALYHGSMVGAKYDNGEKISEGIKISEFDGFDAVLLGDIHKHQVFKKRIVYPSSLVQQNFGEDLKIHGYVKWTVRNLKKDDFLELVKIENDYGFVTVEIKDSKIKNEKNLKNLPKNIRLRVFYENTPVEKVESIIKTFEGKHIVINKIEPVEKKTFADIGNISLLVDKTKTYDKMIAEYLESNPVDEDIKDEVISRIKEKLKLTKETELRNYKILRLEISNIFSYGEKNVIEFSKYKNILGLIGDNFSGKSSIIDCICEALYDDNSKGLTNKDIIRRGQKSGYIKLNVSLNNQEYEITKKYTLSGCKLDLIEVKSGKNINDDDNAKTIIKIKNMFPSKELFRNVHTIFQGNNNGIADETKENRKKLILKILGIDDTTEMAAEYKNELKYLVKDIKEKETQLSQLNIEEQINQLNKICSTFEIEMSEIKDIIKDYDKELNDINFEKVENINFDEETKRLNSEGKKIKSKVKIIEKELVELRGNNITTLPEKLITMKDKIVEAMKLQEKQKTFEELNNNYNQFVKSLDFEKILSLEKEVNHYNNLLKDVKTKQDMLKKQKESYELNEIKKDIKGKLISQINELSTILSSKDNDYRTAMINKNILITEMDKNNKLLLTLTELKKQARIITFLSKAYDKDGIPKLILSKLRPQMEKVISQLTHEICGYNVEIDEDFNIYIVRGEIKSIINSGSGAEKLIMNIAFRLMIKEFGTVICNSNIFFIDESFISFDAGRREMIPEILKTILKKYEKIVLITHMEEIKNLVPSYVNIKKVNGISKVV